MSDRNDLLDFNQNFLKIPLVNTIKNKDLKEELFAFLREWGEENDAWKLPTMCEFMVDHSFPHIINIFTFANRVYCDQKNKLETLTDIEIFYLIVAIWLHDIGMSGLFAPSQNELEKLNKFLNDYGVKPLADSRDIRSGWIRKHHPLLGYYLLTQTDIIKKGLPVHFNDTQNRKILGKIILYHGKTTTKLLASENNPQANYYQKLPALEEISPQKNARNKKINILFLSALLRFLDGCDQTSFRLKIKDLKKQERINQFTTGRLERNIDEKLGPDWPKNSNNYEEIKKFEEGLKKDENIEDSVKKYVGDYFLIRDQIDEHWRDKEKVRDIYFEGKDIWMEFEIDAEEECRTRIIEKIQEELTFCHKVLNYKPFSLPYDTNSLKPGFVPITGLESAHFECLKKEAGEYLEKAKNQDNTNKSLNFIRLSLQCNPDNPEAWHTKADVLMKTEEFGMNDPKTLHELEECFKKYSGKKMLRIKAEFHKKRYEFEKAEEAFKKSLEKDQNSVTTIRRYGTFLKDMGNVLWRKDEEEAKTYFNKAKELFERGNGIIEKATEKTERLKEKERQFLNDYAIFLKEWGAKQEKKEEKGKILNEAYEKFKELLNKYPEHIPGRNALADFLINSGQYLLGRKKIECLKEAEELLLHTIKKYKDAIAMTTLASLYYRHKEFKYFDKAEKLLEDEAHQKVRKVKHEYLRDYELGNLYLYWARDLIRNNKREEGGKKAQKCENSLKKVTESRIDLKLISQAYVTLIRLYLQVHRDRKKVKEHFNEAKRRMDAILNKLKTKAHPRYWSFQILEIADAILYEIQKGTRDLPLKEEWIAQAISFYKEALEGIRNYWYPYWKIAECNQYLKEFKEVINYYYRSAEIEAAYYQSNEYTGDERNINIARAWAVSRKKLEKIKEKVKRDKILYEILLTKALKCSKEAKEYQPNDPQNFYDYGRELIDAGRLNKDPNNLIEARRAFKRAIRLTEKNNEHLNKYYWGIGDIYKELGKINKDEDKKKKYFKKAKNYYIKGVKFEIEYSPSKNNKANLELAKNMWEMNKLLKEDKGKEFKEEYKKALEKIEEDKLGSLDKIDYLYLKGKIKKEKGDYSNAKKSFEEAKKLTFLQYSKEKIEKEIRPVYEGRLGAKFKTITEKVSMKKNLRWIFKDLYLHLGDCYFEEREYDKADEYYLIHAKFEKQQIKHYGLIGNKFWVRGELEIAKKFFTKSLELAPDNAENRSKRATINHSLGWLEKAKEDLKIAVKERRPKSSEEEKHKRDDEELLKKIEKELEGREKRAKVLISLCEVAEKAIKGCSKDEIKKLWENACKNLEGATWNFREIRDNINNILNKCYQRYKSPFPSVNIKDIMKGLKTTREKLSILGQLLKKEDSTPSLSYWNIIFWSIYYTAVNSRSFNDRKYKILLSTVWGLIGGLINRLNEVLKEKMPNKVAIKCLNLSIKLNDENYQSYFNSARRLFDEGEYKEAIRDFWSCHNLLKDQSKKRDKLYNYLPYVWEAKCYKKENKLKIASDCLLKSAEQEYLKQFWEENKINELINTVEKTAENLSELEFSVPNEKPNEKIKYLKNALKVYKYVLGILGDKEIDDGNIENRDEKVVLFSERIYILEAQIELLKLKGI